MAERDQLSRELIKACERGESGTVQELISRGANPSYRGGWLEMTPLHYAARNGHLDVVKLLISDGHSDINSMDYYKCTPLHEACRHGHLSIVKYLIVEGHCAVKTSNYHGETPLDVACREGHLSTVKYLIAEEHCYVKIPFISIQTPLHVACSNGHLDMVKLLISDGYCDINSMDYKGDTALHEACRHGHLSIVKYLIVEGHCAVKTSIYRRETPLHVACWKGHLDVVKLLISDGHSDVNRRNKDGNTALHYACRNGHLDVVKLLISDGHSDINSMDRHKCTPLHEACRHGHLSIVKYLIVEGHCAVKTSNYHGETPLHVACRLGHLSTMKYLIVEGHCDVNISNNSGQTPLHVACSLDLELQRLTSQQCRNYPLDVVKLLISEGHSDVNSRDNTGNTPLHEACRLGHLSTMKYFITEGHCDVNILNNSGQTPLHVACMNGHLDLVKWLISDGHCDIYSWDNDGNTALHEACRHGHLRTVKYLIMEGDCAVKFSNKSRQTPLHVACRNYHLDVVKVLISEGHSDINSMDKDGNTPLHEACSLDHLSTVKYLIMERYCDVNILNYSGQTPLHMACWQGHLSTVKYLIAEGHCDVNISNNSGQTPLHMACWNGHLDVVKWLISDGHCNINSIDNDGNTALHYACSRTWSHLSTVKYLIVEGHCAVNISNNSGETPLHMACWNGHLDVVELLISDAYCDNRQNKDGDTPLHEACRHGHLSIVEYLIVEGHCAVNISNNSGETPLHVACRKGHLDVVKVLISEGHSDINSMDKDGNTPLHEACRTGRLSTVKYLIVEEHCDVNITNNSGWTPLHVACRNDRLDIVKLLISEGHCELYSRNKDGNTPLHEACRYNCAQMVHYLLSETKYIVKKDDRTLLNLTNDPSTIRELLRHGANPENVYADYSSHLPEHAPKQPSESAVKIFTVGDHGAGKSTLVKALEKEGSGFSRIAGRVKKVTGVDEKTAGIIPHKLESRYFGHVTLYDFAGHKEFYASHAAMIRQSMAGSSTAIFLLLADLRSTNEEFIGSILSWLSFIDNQCPLDPKPHIIFVGSHADEIELKGESGIEKSNIVNSLEHGDALKHFEFRGFIAINCCYSQSSSISELRKNLAKSCEALRVKSELSFNTHCFLIYLLDTFQDSEAVKLKDVLSKVSENTALAVSDHRKLLSFIPTDAPRLWEMCEDLHDRGSLLLLRNAEKREESWLILDQATLLKTVPGKVFAPKGFKEHQDLASATGVVPFLKFRDHFPTLNPDMVAQFLCHLEFCQEVTDDEVLQLLQMPLSISCTERVFFFPSLVSIDAPGLPQDSAAQIPAHASPTQIWKPNSDYVYNSGWILQCSQAEHHFTPRFLQVLLLRLAFCFALAPHVKENKSDLQEIKREFYVWKNGLCWVTRKGVAALVQMDESGKTVTALLRCLEYSKLQCVHLRSGIIQKALCAREEFCPKVSTSEYFILPDAIQYPLKPTSELNLFSISQVTRAIAAGDPCVIGTDSQPLHLEKLLYFEPYFHLSKIIVLELFDEEKASRDVDGELMDRIAKCFCNKWDDIFNILKLPDSTVMKQAPQNPDQAIVRLLQLWCLHSRKGSYQCLHKQLDQFSVFAGRHPLSPTTSSLSAQSTAETASEVDSTTDSTLIDSVDETKLDITDLHAVNSELVSVAPRWMELSLSLGLEQPVLDALESNYPRDVNRCLTETLARWLQQVRTARSWRAITHALIVSSINRVDLAHSIAMSHGIGTPKEADSRYQDVNSERLGISNLREVSEEISTVYEWLYLGLALDLSYDTLRTIEIECHQDISHCRTEMLKAWLKGMGGESSWRQLACALDSPLIRRPEIATMIATEHKL